ncbi:uncharacterized protein PHALS_00273 [Plasmopara halstedii]|uniref:Uncharacterized protein n=1 Tax=Plasmopara halstedii TaxID=4781 RepID=A0A0P1A6Z7_PLAHL|nr:uncharacterized protein PHALS_00273 [Plasmopara halstedii]CEG35950.1 hypothetical protein PHALS_00273 [Plasmopara halstedii]|eukprot:XP_024572319.1 hypothetical protein PHALS_00273 [Plasmopara halstedii]
MLSSAIYLGSKIDTVAARVYIPSENTVKFVAVVRVIEDVMYGDRHHVDSANRDDGEWLWFVTEEVGKQDDTTASRVTTAWTWKASMSLTRASYLTIRGTQRLLSLLRLPTKPPWLMRIGRQTSMRRTKITTTRTMGENHQDMSDQTNDGHDDDESVSANFGLEVDPADEGSIADATEEGEDVSDPTDEQGSTHEQGPKVKDHTENSRSKDSPDDDNAGAVTKMTATERSVLEKIVLPEGLRKRVERDDTSSEAEKNQLGERMKERRTGLRQ